MKKDENKVVKLVKETNKECSESIQLQALAMARKYRITKIKITSKAPHFLTAYYSGGNEKGSKEIVYTGYEEMMDEDYFLVQSLVEKVCAILEFPEEWIEEIDITGLSFNYDDENDGALRGMVITMQRKIEDLNCPLNINTPFIKFEGYINNYSSFPANESTWDIKTSQAVAHIIDNTFEYMSGKTKTKQQSLFA